MNPTFIFVSGAWHLPPYWDPLIAALTDAGYDSVAVTPRSVNAKSPVTDLQPDVDAVKEVITDVVSKGKDVIVVMHSYGGCVGTEAVGDLVDGNREFATSIKRLVYLAGWYPAKGQAIAHACAGLAPAIGDPNDAGNIVLKKEAEEMLYHDVPEPQRSVAISHVGTQSLGPFAQQLSHFGWEHVPTTYVHATLDRPLPLRAQQFVVDTTKNRAASGANEVSVQPFSGPLGVFEVEAGHSLMLSKTGEVAGVLVKVAEG